MRDREFNGFGNNHLIFDRPDDVNALWQDQAELLSTFSGSISPFYQQLNRLLTPLPCLWSCRHW
jgi:hypothetical protein